MFKDLGTPLSADFPQVKTLVVQDLFNLVMRPKVYKQVGMGL